MTTEISERLQTLEVHQQIFETAHPDLHMSSLREHASSIKQAATILTMQYAHYYICVFVAKFFSSVSTLIFVDSRNYITLIISSNIINLNDFF